MGLVQHCAITSPLLCPTWESLSLAWRWPLSSVSPRKALAHPLPCVWPPKPLAGCDQCPGILLSSPLQPWPVVVLPTGPSPTSCMRRGLSGPQQGSSGDTGPLASTPQIPWDERSILLHPTETEEHKPTAELMQEVMAGATNPVLSQIPTSLDPKQPPLQLLARAAPNPRPRARRAASSLPTVFARAQLLHAPKALQAPTQPISLAQVHTVRSQPYYCSSHTGPPIIFGK